MPQAAVDIRLKRAGGAFLFRPQRREVGSEVAAGPMADQVKFGGHEMAGSGNRVHGRGVRQSSVSNLLAASILPSRGARWNGENLSVLQAHSRIYVPASIQRWLPLSGCLKA